MDVVNEKSTVALNFRFTDKDGVDVIPDSIRYCIGDLYTEQVVLEYTNIVPGENVIIKITPDQNAIINPKQKMEIRVITVVFTWGYMQGTKEYKYGLNNLKFLE